MCKLSFGGVEITAAKGTTGFGTLCSK